MHPQRAHDPGGRLSAAAGAREPAPPFTPERAHDSGGRLSAAAAARDPPRPFAPERDDDPGGRLSAAAAARDRPRPFAPERAHDPGGRLSAAAGARTATLLGLRAPAGPPQGGEQSPLGGEARRLAPPRSGGLTPPRSARSPPPRPWAAARRRTRCAHAGRGRRTLRRTTRRRR
ncbi:hypothetical protein GALL_298290 [mine drainage metagenome]|uniref:Uncharacterized protein n=1 Tax=mine drainage metagenome TaxID=410659 RepID=A0A1J5QX68_9ZZZZ